MSSWKKLKNFMYESHKNFIFLFLLFFFSRISSSYSLLDGDSVSIDIRVRYNFRKIFIIFNQARISDNG